MPMPSKHPEQSSRSLRQRPAEPAPLRRPIQSQSRLQKRQMAATVFLRARRSRHPSTQVQRTARSVGLFAAYLSCAINTVGSPLSHGGGQQPRYLRHFQSSPQ